MNRRIEQHFDSVESLLLESPAVHPYEVAQRLVGLTDGKLHIRVELYGEGLAEFFEYVVANPDV